MFDPITELDLAAFVDGELSAMRRLEVEEHLARNPTDAAQVMADLRDRDALYQAFRPGPGPGPEHLRVAARRLDRSIAWQQVRAKLQRAAVIALLVGAGWLAHTEIGTFGVPETFASPVDPQLVEEAQQARAAALVRSRTHTQPVAPAYDRADLEAATGLALPDLPSDWAVRDVQVFPARHGSGVEMTIDAKDFGELALFATESGNVPSGDKQPTRSPDGVSAYWQVGRTAFALSGSKADADIGLAVTKLSLKH